MQLLCSLHGCTVSIIGTGTIGMVSAQIMHGFRCTLPGYDAYPNNQFEATKNARYISLAELFDNSDIILIHCPLLPEIYNLINAEAIAKMKSGVMLINTSRDDLIDPPAVITGIKSSKIDYLGIDLYEQDELFS